MPKFIAVHSMPYNEEQIIATVQTMPSQLPTGVSWNITYCAFDDNKGDVPLDTRTILCYA